MSLRPTQTVSGLRRAPGDPVAAGELVAAILAGRVHVDVVVPRTDVRATMRLLTRAETAEVRTATRDVLTRRRVPERGMEDGRDWLEEVATRTIAIAVRQASDPTLALAPLEEWEQCDDDQIAVLWLQYTDLEESSAQIETLSDGELTVLTEAAKKKDEVALRSFGSRKLAHFATTLVDRPAS